VHVLTGWPASAKPNPAALGSTRHKGKGSGDSLSSHNATPSGQAW